MTPMMTCVFCGKETGTFRDGYVLRQCHHLTSDGKGYCEGSGTLVREMSEIERAYFQVRA